jgi:hypothetical protein
MSREQITAFALNDTDRDAIVFKSDNGFEVDFLRGGKVVETRPMYEHNIHYALAACENWVSGAGDFGC